MNGGFFFSDIVFFKGYGKNFQIGVGKFVNVMFIFGKCYCFCIINILIYDYFQLKFQNYIMIIIVVDMVFVQVQIVDSFFFVVGQCYDVIIDVNKSVGNYWFNVIFGGGFVCGVLFNFYLVVVFCYQGVFNIFLINIGIFVVDVNCMDFNNLIFVVFCSVFISGFIFCFNNILFVFLIFGGIFFFVWKVNGSFINVDWDKLIVDYVIV